MASVAIAAGIAAIVGGAAAAGGGASAIASKAMEPGKGKKADDKIAESAELARRRRVSAAAQSSGRRATILGGLGGPQPAASRITLLGGA